MPADKDALGQSFLDGVLTSEQLNIESLPPVEQWSPALNGDLDMRIDREGRWFYEGDEIRRPAMVKMFSRILKREGDDYFLLTPVEKWRIQVDEAPFTITSAIKSSDQNGKQTFVLTTNVGDEILLGAAHPLLMPNIEQQVEEPKPMVIVRHQLPALINRSVFYQLVDEAEIIETVGRRSGMYLHSQGERFCLGYID